jgi:hypothetical protein
MTNADNLEEPWRYQRAARDLVADVLCLTWQELTGVMLAVAGKTPQESRAIVAPMLVGTTAPTAREEAPRSVTHVHNKPKPVSAGADKPPKWPPHGHRYERLPGAPEPIATLWIVPRPPPLPPRSSPQPSTKPPIAPGVAGAWR